MSPRAIVVIAVLAVSSVTSPRSVAASGPFGIYGIVERVVFEPSEAAAERVQIWGAFAYADGTGARSASRAVRGYLYFALPQSEIGGARTAARQEWNDLKSVAGTGQAVAFGTWGYIATFESLQPDRTPIRPSYIYGTGGEADLRVRPASEAPTAPAAYQTNTGVVKLGEANHGAIIATLKEALRQ